MERKKVLKFRSKILEAKALCSDVKHFAITIPENFHFYPGQFISIILKVNGQEFRRPYSIASKPCPNRLDLCIKILSNGKITPKINEFKEGDEIDVIGPMGDFIVKEQSMKKDLVFVSTGTGVTPFRSIIPHLLENNFKNKITLITGYRYEENCLYESEFLELEKKYKNFTYQRILSKPKEGDKGHVQKLVEKNIDKNKDYYICGLKAMVFSVKDLLLEKGIPKENIFFEKYD